MKNVCIIFLLSIIISLTTIGFCGEKGQKTTFNAYMVGGFSQNDANTSDYLRIHIRADSNEGQAQAVKYQVRDALVQYLTPLVAEYKTQAQALQGIAQNLDELAQVATTVLQERGFSYSATVELARENFPTRVYENYTLPAGEYAALIVRLGSGKGDNWWCVVYPPLCFAGEANTNIIYKSKIKEIIESWQRNR